MKRARHYARQLALQGLYRWLVSPGSPEEIKQHLSAAPNFEKADQSYCNQLLIGVIDRLPQLQEGLNVYLDRPVEQLSPVERAAILIGAYELDCQLDIPYRVVINEAVELAKIFGGTDGYKYVNGILDKFAAQVRKAEFSKSI